MAWFYYRATQGSGCCQPDSVHAAVWQFGTTGLHHCIADASQQGQTSKHSKVSSSRKAGSRRGGQCRACCHACRWCCQQVHGIQHVPLWTLEASRSHGHRNIVATCHQVCEEPAAHSDADGKSTA